MKIRICRVAPCLMLVCLAACGTQSQTTSVGLSVGTLVKTSGLIDTVNTCNPAVPPAPDVQAMWNAMPPNNHMFPLVGFELWRNTTDGCLESRLDAYRAAAGSLPAVTGAGVLIRLQPAQAFPSGQTVFTFPSPWTAGAVAGATSTTTTSASGTGGATFTVDVTSQVNAALNGGIAGMSWMLTSAFEGPLTAPVPSAVDCKTSYRFELRLTHL